MKTSLKIKLKSCEHSNKNCSSEFCNNAGTCILEKSTEMGFKCVCDPNYTGSTCTQNINPCASNPCMEGYTCINNPNSEYICICIQGVTCPISFRNLQLTTKSQNTQALLTTSPCSINTCHNDGICEIIDNESYACVCKFGYIGQHCETLNKCLIQPNACKNGGTCFMNGDELSCECPTGFEKPFCDKPETSKFYCELNACKNGGICLHTDLNEFYGMKCVCQTGFTGVFCEDLIEQQENDEPVNEYMDVPVLCKNINKKAEIKKQPLRKTNTPHGNNSYFLVQNGQIWFANSEAENFMYKNNWPKRLSEIFPTIEDNIDAILYDDLSKEYLIFKSFEYWRFRTDVKSPLNTNTLVRGYPRSIKEDFGIISVEGGFFIDLKLNKNSQNATEESSGDQRVMLLFKDSKIITFNKTKPIGIHFLPFDLSPIQTAVNIDSKSFYVLYENRIFNFWIDYNTHQAVLKSIDANIKQSLL